MRQKHTIPPILLGFTFAFSAVGCMEATQNPMDEVDESIGEAESAFTASAGGPICVLNASKSTGDAPLTTTLTASCTDPQNDPITAYYIVCNNGGSSYFGPSSSSSCTYTSVGSFSPFVQAMDAAGNWGPATSIGITTRSSVHSEPEYYTTSYTNSCVTVHLDGAWSYSNQGPIVQYHWVANGTTYSGAINSFVYCGYGTINVSLTVIDSHGYQDTAGGPMAICPTLFKNKGFCGVTPRDDGESARANANETTPW